MKIKSGALFVVVVLLSLVVAAPGVLAQVVATSDWCDFYSTSSTLDGAPVPAGAVIDAYDPQGVHCGTFTVATAGVWGVMHVYADDEKPITIAPGQYGHSEYFDPLVGSCSATANVADTNGDGGWVVAHAVVYGKF